MLKSAEHEIFLPLNVKMPTIVGIFVKMPTIVGILTFMSRENIILGLSEPEKSWWIHTRSRSKGKNVKLYLSNYSKKCLHILLRKNRGQGHDEEIIGWLYTVTDLVGSEIVQ